MADPTGKDKQRNDGNTRDRLQNGPEGQGSGNDRSDQQPSQSGTHMGSMSKSRR